MNRKHRLQHHDEGHIDETWLIPYADLLTLLLALFIVLFASSTIDMKKFDEISRALSSAFKSGTGFLEYASLVPQTESLEDREKSKQQHEQKATGGDDKKRREETIELEKLKQLIDQYIQKNGLSSQLETKLNFQQLRITISDNALFSSGSATVKPEARKLAVSISDMLEQYPHFEVVVSGHTDNEPIHTKEFESNWDLSSKRALNFMKILLENSKLDPGRFSAIGYGEFRPVSSNDTVEGRAKNRRVEVSILRNYQEDSP